MGRNAIHGVARRNSLAVTLVSWLHGGDANSLRLAVKAGFFFSKSPLDAAAERRPT